MWEKKAIQTDYDTVKSHKDAADDAYRNSRKWKDISQAHGHYLDKYGRTVSSSSDSG